jgi:hypothetical protein
MKKLSKVIAFLAIAAGSYWLLKRQMNSSSAKKSPVILFASYDSGVGGSWLTFRADSTYQFTEAGFLSDTVTTGHYTRTDSVILVDRIPKTSLLKSKRLLVRYLPLHDSLHTGNMVWQTDKSGKVDSTLVVFTGYPYHDVKAMK